MRDLIVKLIDALTPADETVEEPALSVETDSREMVEEINEEPEEIPVTKKRSVKK